ncbi:RNA ligase family protein [Sorangium sp. So ce1024]|uniref:RNA ligase family protein n=1 Tax=Sorangium sp. So ce1024 TaxID=3133327 RepID=UPI003EFDAB02
MNLRDIDLRKLNSITKYPSIPTYHVMGDGGRLTEERQVTFDGEVYLSEKVDGTNSRLIVSPDGDYIIGSREELLHARGDRIWNPSMGIVDAVRPVAERFFSGEGWTSAVMVLFMETYGGNVGGSAKQYTGSKAVSVRLFDVIVFDGQLEEMARKSPEEIAAWRESGGQPFVPSAHTEAHTEGLGIEPTPRLGVVDASEIPASIADTAEWLASKLDRTRCAIDAGAGGAPEGIIARSADRSRIAKLRFKDYRRTLKGKR